MKILLDTNALLWLLQDSPLLSVSAREHIEKATEITVSEVSLWEISIKVSIGKLLPIPELFATIHDLGFRRLNLRDAHLSAYENLPLIHRDPFDRMLVAQALSENLALLTSDTILKKYGAKIISAKA